MYAPLSVLDRPVIAAFVRLTLPLTAIVAQRAADAIPQSVLDQAAAWLIARITVEPRRARKARPQKVA